MQNKEIQNIFVKNITKKSYTLQSTKKQRERERDYGGGEKREGERGREKEREGKRE